MKNIQSLKAAAPVGPYPHAKKVGNFLFLSGIGPRSRVTNQIPESIDEQFKAIMLNLQQILEESNANIKNIVDITVFLTNMSDDFSLFNKTYAQYFDATSGPCRTTVEVTALPTPINIELKCVAYLE